MENLLPPFRPPAPRDYHDPQVLELDRLTNDVAAQHHDVGTMEEDAQVEILLAQRRRGNPQVGKTISRIRAAPRLCENADRILGKLGGLKSVASTPILLKDQRAEEDRNRMVRHGSEKRLMILDTSERVGEYSKTKPSPLLHAFLEHKRRVRERPSSLLEVAKSSWNVNQINTTSATIKKQNCTKRTQVINASSSMDCSVFRIAESATKKVKMIELGAGKSLFQQPSMDYGALFVLWPRVAGLWTPRVGNPRSVVDCKEVMFEFKNSNLEDIAYIYWIDYHGELVLRKKLCPGHSHKEQSFETHPWLISIGKKGNCRELLCMVNKIEATDTESIMWNSHDQNLSLMPCKLAEITIPINIT